MLNLLHNVALRELNTFGVAATADTLVETDNADELADYLRSAGDLASRALVLGGGSNVLFVSERTPLVIRYVKKGIKTLAEDADNLTLNAEAGEVWDDVVQWTLSRNLSGLENLSGVPGTAGASAVQNIGAYGAEAADAITAVETLDLHSLERLRLTDRQCEFGYRNSRFKREPNRYLVLNVDYRAGKQFQPNVAYAGLQTLLEGKSLTPQTIRETVLSLRNSKLPDYHAIHNAGSFFKNPMVSFEQSRDLQSRYPKIPMYSVGVAGHKTSAAWLIEQCGWKGTRHGNVGCYERQPLVLVNYGDATGKDIWHFAEEIIASVKERFGLQLEPEVVVV
jgi:UDP-N-acetylmuramate dehydrogenase